MRIIASIVSSRGCRATFIASVTIIAWATWSLMPERPVREWRIPGEFGVCWASVDVDAETALISAVTNPYPASFRDRHSGCFANNVGEPGISAKFLLDLHTGHRDCLETIDYRTGQFTHSPNSEWKSKYDFGEPLQERWWMAWKRDDVQWVLRDADSQAVIASNQCDAKTFVGKPAYPSNRRWITIGEHRPNGENGFLTTFLRRWINWPARGNDDLQLLVFDPTTGSLVNDLPSWTVCRWTPDGDHFWTVDTVYSAKNEARGVACRLWRARAHGPPWWLVSMTIGGGIMFVWGRIPLWRSIRPTGAGDRRDVFAGKRLI